MKSLAVLTVALWLVSSGPLLAGNWPTVEKRVIIDDDAARSLTNSTERLLHQIRIPKVEFAQAAITDIVFFLNDAIKKYGDTEDARQITVVLDPDTERQLMKVETWEGGGGIKGVYTYGGLDMSVLEAIQVLSEVAQLNRTINGTTLILTRKNEIEEVQPAGGADFLPGAVKKSAHP